jgi:hypothetical protein
MEKPHWDTGPIDWGDRLKSRPKWHDWFEENQFFFCQEWYAFFFPKGECHGRDQLAYTPNGGRIVVFF